MTLAASFDRESRIFVAGHTGLLGSALLRRCRSLDYPNVITRSHADLDLRDAAATLRFFEDTQPEYVILAAARVGGIWANQTFPAEFIQTNLMIQTSVFEAARRVGVKRLIFFGSGCCYPRVCAQPMAEELLHTGPVEPSSEPYAMAKLAGITMCKAYNAQYSTQFVPVIPCTLYGPNDNFDPNGSHVMSALIRRFDTAKQEAEKTGRIEPVVVWGSGTPRREFLYADDMADACLLVMGMDWQRVSELLHPDTSTVNVGVGTDVSIASLASTISKVVGFGGEIVFDATKPDGAPRKLLDSARFRTLSWAPKVSLEQGIGLTYQWYESNTPK